MAPGAPMDPLLMLVYASPHHEETILCLVWRTLESSKKFAQLNGKLTIMISAWITW